MSTCKFCGISDGVPDRRGNAAHINRDSLCAPCNYILEQAKAGTLDAEEADWLDAMCVFNERHGMFVPPRLRKKYKKWRCKCCGTELTQSRDAHYTSYCEACASNIRRGR